MPEAPASAMRNIPHYGNSWNPADPELFVDQYLSHDFSLRQLADLHDSYYSQVYRYVEKMKLDGVFDGTYDPTERPETTLPKPKRSDEFSNNGNTWNIDAKVEQEVRSVDELCALFNIDQEIWECERFRCGSHQQGYKDNKGQGHKQSLLSIKATFVRRKGAEAVKFLVPELLKDLEQQAPVFVGQGSRNSGRMVEMCIPDLHIGKLCWGEETGRGNYDAEIAEEVFMQAVYELTERVKHHDAERVLFVVGNDLLNADGLALSTTNGTTQQVDGRWQKLFRAAVRIVHKAVTEVLLPNFGAVDILVVPGNHDQESSFYIGEVLHALYANSDDVSVDNTPKLRKYYQYGVNMLGFTHGKDEKHADLPLIMAQEAPDMWATSTHREIHLGHLHQRRQMKFMGVQEQQGVAVRILPSLCETDDWHAQKGYVGNMRMAEAYVWDKFDGLVSIENYTAKG